MTHDPEAMSDATEGTVYGEPITELLPALAAICSGPARHEDMLCLSLTLPPSAGGTVRRALLRSLAEILRREADALGPRAPVPTCLHCRGSEALLAVAEQLQRVARAIGVTGTTIAERALLLGQLTSSTACGCRAIS